MNTVMSILYHEQRNAGQWATPEYRGILIECRRWYADRPEYPVDDICLDAFVWRGTESVESYRIRLPMEKLTDAQVQRHAIWFFDALLSKYTAMDESWWPLVEDAQAQRHATGFFDALLSRYTVTNGSWRPLLDTTE